MKLISRELSQVSQFTNFTVPSGSIYLPEAINGLRERYNFIKTPDSLEALDLSKGITFSHGKFREAVIDTFNIYSTGLLVQTKSTVENAELFIEDIIAWAEKQFDAQLLEIETESINKTLDSHVVVQMDIDLPNAFGLLMEIGNSINRSLSNYGIAVGNYVPAGVTFHSDTYEVLGLKPSTFTIERRAGTPFSSNLYFSTAPLRSEDHLKLLEKLEQLI